MLPGVKGRTHRLNGLFDDALEKYRLTTQDKLIAGQTRYLQQVFNEPHHVTNLTGQDGTRLMRRRTVLAGYFQHLQGAQDRRQRIAQLVRQHGQKLVLAAIGPLQFGLQLREPMFGFTLDGHIARQGADAEGPVVVGTQTRINPHLSQRSIAATHA